MKPTPGTQQVPLMVTVRVRPMNAAENKANATKIAHSVDKKLVVLMDPHDDSDDILRANRSREKKFVFDRAFDCYSTQENIYDATVRAKDMVEKVTNGYNCAVFAYGATGTGKTHTMLGTVNEPGIMMLALNDLFNKVEETKHDMIYKVSMAYLEIYNEMVRDLLANEKDAEILDLREDGKGELQVSGLKDIETNSTSEIMGWLSRGNQRRTCEPTAANKTSSRSHAVLKVSIEQRSRSMEIKQEVRHGVLFMVDLAGSERAAVTQNRGKRMIEGAHINRSLLALANCINALTSSTSFINYRDSKLTRLLKVALGGNCTTVMIAHLSPASTVFEESRNTLAYAERGMKIKNKTRQNIVDVNYHVTQYHYIIDELHGKIEFLQSELDRQQPGSPEDKDRKEVTVLCDQLKAISQEEKEIRQEILTLEYHLLQTAVECQKHLVCIQEWEQKRASLTRLPKSASRLEVSSVSDFTSSQNEQTTQPSHLAIVDSNPSSSVPDGANTIRSSSDVQEIQSSEDRTDGTRTGGSTPTEDQFSEGYIESTDIETSSEGPRETSPIELALLTKSGSISASKTQTPKAQVFFPESSPLDNEIVTSPDSGTCTEVPTDLPMEPASVSSAREELATLVADKQRMEAQHRRLEGRHQENTANMAHTKEKISNYPGIHPIRKELIDLLCRSCEIEASGVEHSLAATLMSIQLGRHESVIDQLLTQSSLLMEMVAQLQSAMAAQKVPVPVDVSVQCRELTDRQRALRAQVGAEKQMPLLSKKMQLPHLARLSSKLYTTMTGSKSNLFIDETIPETKEVNSMRATSLTDPGLALSDIQLLPTLPSAVQSPQENSAMFPSFSTSTLATVSQIIPSFLQLSSSSLVAEPGFTLPPIAVDKLPHSSVPTVSKAALQDDSNHRDSKIQTIELDHIMEKARLARLKQCQSVKPFLRDQGRALTSFNSPKKVLSKVASFTTPRNSVSRCSTKKAKYVISKSVSCSNTYSDIEESETTIPTSRSKHSKSIASVGSDSTDYRLFSKTRKNPKKNTLSSRSTSKIPAAKPSMSKLTMEQLVAKRRKMGSIHSTIPFYKTNRKLSQLSATNINRPRVRPSLGQHSVALLANRTSRPTKLQQPKSSTATLSSPRSDKKLTKTIMATTQRHPIVQRKELPISKVIANSQFSNIVSPYLSPLRLPRKQGRSQSLSRGRLSPFKHSRVWK